MDNQLMSNVKGKELDVVKAQSIGRDLELVQPSDINKIEQDQISVNDDLSEFAKKIVYLKDDKKRKLKTFNLLLSLKELHPSINLNDFVNTHLKNNGAATSQNISEAFDCVKRVNNLDSKQFDSSEAKGLEPKRRTMTNALKVVGIYYNSKPRIETLAQDFKNVIIDGAKKSNSFDWNSLSESISNVTDSATNVANGIGNVMGSVNQVKDMFTNRPDVSYIPPTYSQPQAEQIFLQAESKESDNSMYFVIGGAVLFGIIILLMFMKK